MGPEVAVLDSLSFTFDAKDFQIMATEDTKKPGEGEGGEKEMTIAELTALVKTIAPKIAELTVAMEALKANPAAAATVEDTTKTDPAAAAAAMDAADKARTDAAIAEAIKGVPGAVMKALAERDALAKKLSDHVGVFDASDMTREQVATYGIEKLGIKDTIPAGNESVYLTAYLSALPAPSTARAKVGKVADVTDAADEDTAKVPDSLAKYIA
jgi:hypothetical protein